MCRVIGFGGRDFLGLPFEGRGGWGWCPSSPSFPRKRKSISSPRRNSGKASVTRHPGEGRDPVPRRHSGGSRNPFAFAPFWSAALSRKPTHVRVRVVDRPWSPVTFFCLPKR